MTRSGLDQLAFAPGKTLAPNEWPTLGELIAGGHRAVVFTDRGADPKHPALLDEWDYYFEPPFNIDNPADLRTCKMDRFRGDAAPPKRMYIVNHFLDKTMPVFNIKVPDVEAAGTTNSPQSIWMHAQACEGSFSGYTPNVMLLDFVDLGDGLAWERQANGVERAVV